VESDPGEFKDRRDSVGFDLFSSEITWSFKVFDMNNGASHPSLLSSGTGNMAISRISEGNILPNQCDLVQILDNPLTV
jgi:hypothetical protein